MRSVAILGSVLLLLVSLAGCAGSDPPAATTTSKPATTSSAVPQKDAVVIASGEVTKDRTVRIVIAHTGGHELKSQSFTVTPAEKNVKKEQFTHKVPAQDFNLRVFEGTNPVGTEKVQPQTCSGSKVEVDVHLTDDQVHITWKCG